METQANKITCCFYWNSKHAILMSFALARCIFM